MKAVFPALLLSLALLFSCGRPGVKGYWDAHGLDYSNVLLAQDRFGEFCERAVAAPREEARKELDHLFDLLLQDTVAYYLYTEWIGSAFYSPLSPCRNAVLFSQAVQRMVQDGVLNQDECEPLIRQREWALLNIPGEPALVPGVALDGRRTLVLVLDLSCPSCREALELLAASPEWARVRRVAIGCGEGPQPAVPGWEYVFPDNAAAFFDPQLTPVYYVVSPDGTVEASYTLVL